MRDYFHTLRFAFEDQTACDFSCVVAVNLVEWLHQAVLAMLCGAFLCQRARLSLPADAQSWVKSQVRKWCHAVCQWLESEDFALVSFLKLKKKPYFEEA